MNNVKQMRCEKMKKKNDTVEILIQRIRTTIPV